MHRRRVRIWRAGRWQRWFEPWYLAYGLLGISAGGLVMIFLPIGIDRGGSATHVGLIMALVAAGQLTAGLWGRLADRYRIHRALLVGGGAAAVGAFVGFAAGPALAGWAILALVLGFGTAAANTVSNLFIVEAHPKPEWDQRIGIFQAVSNAGSVGGLLLASALAPLALRTNFLIGAAITAAAVLLGWATTRTPPRPVQKAPAGVGAGPEPEWSTNTPQRTADYVTERTVRELPAMLTSRYGIFVLSWLLANLGLAAVNGLYPLIMSNVFNIEPRESSLVMGVATGVSILLYAPASATVAKAGEPLAFQVAMLWRAGALAVLVLLGLGHIGGGAWLAAVAWFAAVLAGPLFSVSGTVMASSLAPKAEGEALGQYNAAGSLGALVGSAISGWTASRWGYEAVPVLGLLGVGAGTLLAAALHRARPAASAPAAPAPTASHP